MTSKNLSLRKGERFNPWWNFQHDMRDLLDRFNEDWFDISPSKLMPAGHFVPKIDLLDRDDSYVITAEVPGMTEKDINISLDQNVLILEGEKKAESEQRDKDYFRSEISYGSFYRSIPLEDQVDEAKVQASYKDGVLKINLGKKEGEVRKKRRIPISSQTQMQ